MVELSDGIRKIRRVFLFHDVLVCSKQKASRWVGVACWHDYSDTCVCRGGVKFEAKWYLPLNEISFKPAEDAADGKITD